MIKKENETIRGTLEVEKRDNVVPFSLDSIGDDNRPWILKQELGAMIVIKDMSPQHLQDFAGGVFTIVHKTEKSVRIVNPQKGIDERIIPDRFCRRYALVEVLCTVDLDSIIEEVNKDGAEPQ